MPIFVLIVLDHRPAQISANTWATVFAVHTVRHQTARRFFTRRPSVSIRVASLHQESRRRLTQLPFGNHSTFPLLIRRVPSFPSLLVLTMISRSLCATTFVSIFARTSCAMFVVPFSAH